MCRSDIIGPIFTKVSPVPLKVYSIQSVYRCSHPRAEAIVRSKNAWSMIICTLKVLLKPMC